MRPLTDTKPKALIEVAGKPFLAWQLDLLRAAGITECVIIVGYLGDQIREYVKTQDMKITCVEQKEPKGTGHALLMCKDYMDEPFLLIHGDNLWSLNDVKLLQEATDWGILGQKVENPSKYGVLIVKDGLLERIEEKPQEFVGDLIYSGALKLTPEVFTILEKLEPSPRGEIELTDALSEYAKNNKVFVLTIQDYWLDLGCVEDVEKLNAFLEENN